MKPILRQPKKFSGKFLGYYIEAAQDFIRYVTIFVPDWAQKNHLAKLVLFEGCYTEAAQNFIEA